ncbi:MAG: VOC family protein [Paracoccaceae bacterium]|nr:VOC family protein [Paracoccaceae bacterium]
MKLTLHHVNLSTENVEQMNIFYHSVMGLNKESTGLPTLEKNKGYSDNVVFVSDGHMQMHLAQKDLLAGFRMGHTVNPVSQGHIACRTDDFHAFKVHLETHNVPYSDWGNAAVAG